MWHKLQTLLAAALLALTPGVSITPAYAQSIHLPIPEEYQGDAETKMKFVDPYAVEWYCLNGRYDPYYIIYACYDKDKDLIISPNPCLYPEAKIEGTYAHLICHEKAHDNGWRH